MAGHLGKRKRRAESLKPTRKDSPSNSEDDAAVRAAFQRAFEAKFNPVEVEARPAAEPAGRVLEDDRSEEEDEDEDWSGFSGSENEDEDEESEEEPRIETVEFGAPRAMNREQEKAEKKAFMVGREIYAVSTSHN